MATESSKIDIKDLSRQQLADWLKDRGRRPFRTDQILRWVYLRQADQFDDMTDIGKPLRADLEASFINPRLQVESEAVSQDGSRKLLFTLHDGLHIETVVIPEKNHFTLCISSQVGCRHGCRFCMTARGGFARNLSAGEIISQVRDVLHQVSAQGGMPLTNIVFMGMGEPLDNLDNVLKAIEILTDNNGPGISPRNVTVSTVGRVDGLRRLREQCTKEGWRRLGIAISVNAPNDEVRNSIMPINRKWNMAELQEVLIDFPRSGNVPIMIEYVLIPGVNDADAHADELVEFVRPLHCAVNIIPYNPRRDSPWPAPSEPDVDRFVERVRSHGVFTKRRGTKGRDQMAACGQLGTEHIRGRKMVDLTTGKTG